MSRAKSVVVVDQSAVVLTCNESCYYHGDTGNSDDRACRMSGHQVDLTLDVGSSRAFAYGSWNQAQVGDQEIRFAAPNPNGVASSFTINRFTLGIDEVYRLTPSSFDQLRGSCTRVQRQI
jgi:hypothetical protein